MRRSVASLHGRLSRRFAVGHSLRHFYTRAAYLLHHSPFFVVQISMSQNRHKHRYLLGFGLKQALFKVLVFITARELAVPVMGVKLIYFHLWGFLGFIFQTM